MREKISYKLTLVGRQSCWCNDEVEMVGSEGVDWFFVAQDMDKLRGSCVNSNELPDSVKGRKFIG